MRGSAPAGRSISLAVVRFRTKRFSLGLSSHDDLNAVIALGVVFDILAVRTSLYYVRQRGRGYNLLADMLNSLHRMKLIFIIVSLGP